MPRRIRISRSSSSCVESPSGCWGHLDAYMISLLKAYWGDAATAANDYCFDYLPRITGDHSHFRPRSP